MVVDLKTILPSALGVFYFCRKWYKIVKAIVEPAVLDAEQRAKDGIIDKADRKAICWDIVNGAVTQGKLPPLGSVRKMIVSKIIDIIAEKLPDFVLTKDVAK